jgi:hypothetical protein
MDCAQRAKDSPTEAALAIVHAHSRAERINARPHENVEKQVAKMVCSQVVFLGSHERLVEEISGHAWSAPQAGEEPPAGFVIKPMKAQPKMQPQANKIVILKPSITFRQRQKVAHAPQKGQYVCIYFPSQKTILKGFQKCIRSHRVHFLGIWDCTHLLVNFPILLLRFPRDIVRDFAF